MAQTAVEEEKELLPLDLELFLAFIHLIQRAWIAWIIIIILCVIDLTLWNKEAASTVLHMIPAIVIALPIVVERGWGCLGSCMVANTSCVSWSTWSSQLLVLCCQPHSSFQV